MTSKRVDVQFTGGSLLFLRPYLAPGRDNAQT